jgi:phosphatidylserine/phosphatidylglycerophosphate/cardiolipin synthase-like enzyme
MTAESLWFLSAVERANPQTRLYRDSAGQPWSEGNEVRPLIHGAAYLPELRRCIELMQAGDLLMFTDWRGDPDQLMDGPGTEVSKVLSDAARRGVVVKGLVWRSHLDRLSFSEQENRHLGEQINRAGGEVVRDMRVRSGGSHHQKFVVLRHPGRPELDVAFVGGIDLCHSRLDDSTHAGHDIQVSVRGPAVGDVEDVFRERWEDPAPLNRNPLSRLADRMRGEDIKPGALPPKLPSPSARGSQCVQLLRTYPRKRPAFPFAPGGERTVARGYEKAVGLAESLMYVEDQYFWNAGIVASFADALRRSPTLRLVVVVPMQPDQDGRFTKPPNLVGRQQAIDLVRRAGGDRVGVYGIENHRGVPVYVHAKVAIIDDVWASVGSDNINRRSWTHDSELACAIVDGALDERPPDTLDCTNAGARAFARELRLALAAEHLDRQPDDVADLCDPVTAFRAFAECADQLQRWHENGNVGARPPGRLRHYPALQMPRRTQAWSTPLYRTIYDPDGRPWRERTRRAPLSR